MMTTTLRQQYTATTNELEIICHRSIMSRVHSKQFHRGNVNCSSDFALHEAKKSMVQLAE